MLILTYPFVRFSRGRVYINSTNPFDPIVIDPQYFSHPADRTIMRQGVKLVRQVGAALGTLLGTETTPGSAVQTDDEIDTWLTRTGANTQYHPAGSCAMLPKKWGGVVDGKMKDVWLVKWQGYPEDSSYTVLREEVEASPDYPRLLREYEKWTVESQEVPTTRRRKPSTRLLESQQ